jgi:hypothetical protein
MAQTCTHVDLNVGRLEQGAFKSNVREHGGWICRFSAIFVSDLAFRHRRGTGCGKLMNLPRSNFPNRDEARTFMPRKDSAMNLAPLYHKAQTPCSVHAKFWLGVL